MNKLTGLMEHICSFENLHAAYTAAAKGKRYREEVLIFGKDLESNIYSIQESLTSRTYTVGPYREFCVQYPKPRLVMALSFWDRVVQWAIYRQINPYAEKRFIEHSYGCRIGKGTLAAAQQLHKWLQQVSRKPDAEQWTILKCDVSKYFYRVDHKTILKIYGKYINDEWFDWLIGTIVDNPAVPFGLPEGMSISDCPREERLYDVGMPIGNLTSQETANMYLNEVDQYAKHTLRIHHYIRYMDDTIILMPSRKAAEQARQAIERYMKEELLLTMNKKTVLIPAKRGCEFVGYRVTAAGLRLRKKTTKHIKRALNHQAGMIAKGTISPEKAAQTVSSYLGACKHINGGQLRSWIEGNTALK